VFIAIMAVEFSSEPESEQWYIVTTDKSLDKTKIEGEEVVYISTPLAEYAIKAYENNQKTFYLPSGEGVEILIFKPLADYNDQIEVFGYGSPHSIKSGNQAKPVFLYKTTCHCYACRKRQGFDDIVTIKANVETVTGEYRLIDVEFCKNCNKYFISEVQLAQYENTFGTFMITREYQREDPEYQSSSSYFAPDSVLSRHGYYVSQSKDPGERRRREILWMLLHNEIASKGELKEILSGFIAYRSDLQIRAKMIWREDLRFLLSLEADEIRSDTFLYIEGKRGR
jgi:ribosomal protein L44E